MDKTELQKAETSMSEAAQKPPKPGVVPSIVSPDCDKHIAWIKNVFRAEQEELYRSKDEKTVMHCSLIVNGGYIYLYDKSSAMENRGEGREDGAETETGEDDSRGIVLHLELEEPKTFWKNALDNGGTVLEDLKQQYFGTVYGSIRDPFGFVWGLMKGGECRKPGVIPYLVLEEGKCGPYLEWLEGALGAKVKDKVVSQEKEGGLVEHCSVEVNSAMVYLADRVKMDGHRAGATGLPAGVVLHMDLADAKSSWGQFRENGGTALLELEVQFWGDLFGVMQDPTGYRWSFTQQQQQTALPPSRERPTTGGKDVGVLSYILSPDCEKHIKWIERVFDGEVKDLRHTETKKKIMHCAMSVNNGTLMLADRCQDDGNETTPTNGETSQQQQDGDQKGFILHVNVTDPEVIWKKALSNGGVQVVELREQFWGGTYGLFQDPFGYQWGLLKS